MQDQRLLNNKNKNKNNKNNNAASFLLGAVKGPATPFTISRGARPSTWACCSGRAREPARGRIASQFPHLTYSLHCPLNSLTNNLTSSATTSLLTNKHTNTGHQTQNPSLAAGVVCLCLCVCCRGQHLR